MKPTVTWITNTFKDPTGRVVIWQSPNLLLGGWILCKIVSLAITNDRLDSGFSHLASALLLAWAYFEMTKGVNTFRKALGVVVFGFTVVNLFM